MISHNILNLSLKNVCITIFKESLIFLCDNIQTINSIPHNTVAHSQVGSISNSFSFHTHLFKNFCKNYITPPRISSTSSQSPLAPATSLASPQAVTYSTDRLPRQSAHWIVSTHTPQMSYPCSYR